RGGDGVAEILALGPAVIVQRRAAGGLGGEAPAALAADDLAADEELVGLPHVEALLAHDSQECGSRLKWIARFTPCRRRRRSRRDRAGRTTRRCPRAAGRI